MKSPTLQFGVKMHPKDNDYLSKYLEAIKIYREFCKSLLGCSCDEDGLEPGFCIGCEAVDTLECADSILKEG